MGQDAFALLKAGAKTKHEQPKSKQQNKRQRSLDTGHAGRPPDPLKSQRQVVNATDTAQASAPSTTPPASTASKPRQPQSHSSTAQDPKTPVRNAFSILSASAEKAFQAHHFYCGLHNGQWQCEIWPVGQANTRLPNASTDWSAQARVTFKPRSAPPATPAASPAKAAAPAAQQAEVRLRSNVPSGATSPPQTLDGRRLAAALEQPLPLGERYSGGVPLLKSALQKCVRRRLAREAARLAHALLAAAPADALRRVAVMCIEDAALHPRLPAVVWMMMAVAKGFALTADHCALAVRVVWDLAQARVRDTLPERQAAAATGVADLMSVAKALPGDAAAEARALVSCLLLRAAYGGMAGDVHMLQSAAATWLRRFQDHAACTAQQLGGGAEKAAPGGSAWAPLWTAVFPAAVVPWTGIHQLRRRDFPLAGVDHHVSRILTPLLSDDAVLAAVEELCGGGDLGDDPEAVLGTLLWQYRSGVSHKRPISMGSPGQACSVEALANSPVQDEEVPALAKRICSLADEYSVRYIARSFS